MDTEEGVQEDPLSLHKYLYCQANPVNLLDPSGNMTLTELGVSTLNIARLAAQVGMRVYAAYDRVTTVRDVAQFIYTVAATGSVNPIALAALTANFVPFGKVFKGMAVVGRRITGVADVLADVYRQSGKSAKLVGEVGAGLAARAHGFQSIHFTPKYHGIDDIVEDAAGNLIIVEAKGGTSTLGRVASGNQQMSQGWILEKIQKLRNGDATAQAWAKKIDDARQSGKLKGMTVTTKVDGVDAFVPAADIKDWAQIGATSW